MRPTYRRSRRGAIAVAVIAAASCAFAILAFGVETKDDAYITYWVAEQLALHGHLVNVNGSHLEQSSSLADVVVLALLYLVTRAPLAVLGYVVGLASLAATIAMSAVVARRIRPGTELAAALAVAVAFPLVFWSTGGLETLLAAAGVLWLLAAMGTVLAATRLQARTLASYACASVLVVTVRPDTMLVAVGLGVLVLAVALVGAARRPTSEAPSADARNPWIDVGRGCVAAGIVVGAAGGLTVFRLVEFHELLPQPDLSKAGGASWLPTGFSYVFSSLPAWMWLVLLVLVALGAWWSVVERSILGLLCAVAFGGGTTALMFTRGDWMGAGRLLVPYLAPGLILAVLGAWSLRLRWRPLAISALVAVECTSLAFVVSGENWASSQFTSPYGASAAVAFEADDGSLGAPMTSSIGSVPALPWYIAWDYLSTRDAVFLSTATPVLRALLHASVGQRLTLGSDQGGKVIFTWQGDFPGRIEFLDMDDVETSFFSACPGLHESYGGDIITLSQWARDAGHCAPPLPDLFLSLGAPAAIPGLLARYHVIASASMTYDQGHLFGPSTLLGNTEFLAVLDTWHPQGTGAVHDHATSAPRFTAGSGASPRTRGTGSAR